MRVDLCDEFLPRDCRTRNRLRADDFSASGSKQYDIR
jgi:hypothetical protein